MVGNTFKKFNIYTCIERSRSGEGCHLWIFFNEEVSAKIARYFGNLILNYTLENNVGLNLGSYDRLFPNQDKMPKGGFGNLITLPLQRGPAKDKNSLFVDTNFEYYKDQWEYLSNVKKVTLTEVNAVINLLEKEVKTDLSINSNNTVHNVISDRKISYKTNIIDIPSEIDIILSNGILCASTSFGKTVVAINIIATRKVNTLIIVNSIQLLEQWDAKLKIFLEIGKHSIGRLGGGKKKVSNIIDIATMQTLNKNNDVDKILNNYGQIIIDECHHIAAFTFEKIMKCAKNKYILGLTATPNRKDKYDKIITMQCGPVVHKAISKVENEKKIAHMLIPRNNEIQSHKDLSKLKLAELFNKIMNDKSRNELIINDVIESFNLGSTPLVLTERVEHLNILSNMLSTYTDRIVVLKGGMKNTQRNLAIDMIKSFSKDEQFIILATGKYIGEGFDEPRLDTLFLTMPISWKGILEQYAGRLQRTYEGKNVVKIYDYVDNNVSILVKMYNKRLKGYKNLDYNIEENTGIQYEFEDI